MIVRLVYKSNRKNELIHQDTLRDYWADVAWGVLANIHLIPIVNKKLTAWDRFFLNFQELLYKKYKRAKSIVVISLSLKTNKCQDSNK